MFAPPQAGRLTGPTPTPTSERNIVVSAKRKKQQEGPEHAPRITQDTAQVFGGVRNYIKLVRSRNEADRRSQLGKVKQSFRRKKLTSEEISEKKREEEEQAKEAASKPTLPSLINLYGTRGEKNPPVLLLDGYNVMYKMIEQNRKRFKDMQLDQMRDEMEEDLIMYSQFRGIKVAIAYDAQGSTLPGSGDFDREFKCGMELIFCRSHEADVGILAEANRFLAEGTDSVMTVTSDQQVQVCCFNPPYMFVQRAEVLLKDIKQVRRELTYRLQLNNAQKKTSQLRGIVQNQTMSDLQKMRNDLIQKGRWM